jgi:hypothetical protein
MLTKTDSGRTTLSDLDSIDQVPRPASVVRPFHGDDWFKVLTPFGWFAVCAIVMGAAVALAI